MEAKYKEWAAESHLSWQQDTQCKLMLIIPAWVKYQKSLPDKTMPFAYGSHQYLLKVKYL
jgi:hypothetical protein